jgi:hypothetical protein
MTYTYAPDDCDVVDKRNLSLYRTKRAEWIQLLTGKDDHAVSRQISAMLWNDAVFRVANESRRLSRKAGYPSSARNWSLAQFMDQGFVATQTLSIRKLMEKASNKPARQVISLRRVLDDIRSHRALFTRENYVAHDGLPYDPVLPKEAHFNRIISRGSGVHTEWLETTGPRAWSTSELANAKFDQLSAVGSEARSRGDLIQDRVFDDIETMLTESGWENIVEFGNKFIAHAADAFSRSSLIDGQNGFSLGTLAKCHRGICRAAAAIQGAILWEGAHGMMPIPQFNHFDNLTDPWLSQKDVEALSDFWDAHVETVEKWSEDDPFDRSA